MLSMPEDSHDIVKLARSTLADKNISHQYEAHARVQDNRGRKFESCVRNAKRETICLHLGSQARNMAIRQPLTTRTYTNPQHTILWKLR